MGDPRLNSVHLEALPRREDFRKARAQLVSARGQHTIALEDRPETSVPTSKTLVDAARPAGVRVWLVDRDKTFPLKVGMNHVGRMPDNDIILADASISRRHCTVLVHSTMTCELHDTASRNGTFLNGRRITEPTPLKHGDEIRICDRPLIFQMAADATKSPDSQPLKRPDSHLDSPTCVV